MSELIDIFLRKGEFDITKLKYVKGICYHKNGSIKITDRRSLIEDIDIVPYPTRDLFDMEKHYLVRRNAGTARKISRATDILTSRGCPYNCVYCASSYFWRRRIRSHSPEYIVGEMKEIIEKYKVEEISIQDDLFGSDKNRLKRVVELIKKERINEKVRFCCLSRVNIIDDDRCKLFKEMGVAQLSFGFESGCPKTLRFLKKDTVTVEQNKNAVLLGKKYGFDVLGYFMIGVPNETKEDMMMTLDFIRNNPVDIPVTFPLIPFPGTEIWGHCKKHGLVNDNMDWKNMDLAKKDGIFMNEKMSREEFSRILDLFQREADKSIYNVNFKFSDLFSTVVFKYIISHPHRSWNFFYNSVLKRIGERK